MPAPQPPINGTTPNGVHPAAPAAKPSTAQPSFSSIPDTLASFAAGNFVIVLDAAHRENEGDLIIAAAHLTPRKAAFLVAHSSGYICAPMPAPRADRLGLPLMVPAAATQDPHRTAYTVTVDADVAEVTTGISAGDRALTCRLLADEKSTPGTFRRPGHVVPLRAKAGGVRERRGHTEAAVDLCRLAGVGEVGVIGELVTDGGVIEGVAEREGGGMMRRDECLAFGARFGICVCTIEDLVAWVEEKEGVLEGVVGRDY